MCADAINNCANYGQGVCSDPTYTDWVSKNCQAYCHKCSTGTMTGGTMTGTGTGGTIYYPSGSGTGGGTMTGGTMTGTGTGGTMTGGIMTGTGTGTGTGSSGTSTGKFFQAILNYIDECFQKDIQFLVAPSACHHSVFYTSVSSFKTVIKRNKL